MPNGYFVTNSLCDTVCNTAFVFRQGLSSVAFSWVTAILSEKKFGGCFACTITCNGRNLVYCCKMPTRVSLHAPCFDKHKRKRTMRLTGCLKWGSVSPNQYLVPVNLTQNSPGSAYPFWGLLHSSSLAHGVIARNCCFADISRCCSEEGWLERCCRSCLRETQYRARGALSLN